MLVLFLCNGFGLCEGCVVWFGLFVLAMALALAFASCVVTGFGFG